MNSFKKFVRGKARKGEGSGEDKSKNSPETGKQTLDVPEETLGRLSVDEELGLATLHEPQPPESATLDVIFVHGLTGGRRSTWTHAQSRVFWPEDSLPEDLPNARIMTYGYDADVVHPWRPTGANSIEDHSTNLLVELSQCRMLTDTVDRPIVFLGHSLGGLVIQNTLLISQYSADKSVTNIYEKTRAIAFLGTPHCGADYAAWADMGVRTVGIFKTVPKNLLSDLRTDSKALYQMQVRFTHLLRNRETPDNKIEVACYYEELPMRGLGFIVTQQSASFSKDYHSVSIHANHRDMTKFAGRDALGYKRVVSQLILWSKNLDNIRSRLNQEEHEMAQPKEDMNFRVTLKLPQKITSNFVDRPVEIDKMEQILDDEAARQRRQILIIHGIGGAGKTQLMLEYTRRHKENYSAIFWLDGSSIGSLKSSILNQLANVPSPDIKDLYSKHLNTRKEVSMDPSSHGITLGKVDEETILRAFIDWLSIEANKNWLLLFDNVDREFNDRIDDPQAYDIQSFVPEVDHGAIIITTRQGRLGRMGHSIPLTRMSIEESVKLLSDRSGYSIKAVQKEAKDLLSKLDGLPLALAQAGTYIKECGCSFDVYLDLYNNKWRDVMERDDWIDLAPHDYLNGTVGTTWAITYEHIVKHIPLAASLLRILAYFHGREISHDIFCVDNEQAVGPSWEDPPPIVDQIYEKLSFYKLMSQLLAFSLVQKRSNSGIYEVHQVLQDWCIASSTAQEREDDAFLAFRLLGFSCARAQNIGWRKSVDIRKRLGAHVSRLTELVDYDMNKMSVEWIPTVSWHYRYIGLNCSSRGKFWEASQFMRKSYDGFKSTIGLASYDTWHSADILGSILLIVFECDQAVQVLEEVCEEISLNSSNIVESQIPVLFTNLADAYVGVGKISEAAKITTQLSDMVASNNFQANGHQANEQLLYLRYRLGSCLRRQGQFDLAERNFKIAYPLAKALDGIVVSNAGLILDELQEILKLQGKYDEARQLLQDFKLYLEGKHGLAHDWSLDLRSKMGLLESQTGMHLNAEKIFRELHGDRLKRDGQESAESATTLHMLALTMVDLKQFDEAEALLKKCLAWRVKNFGPNDLDVFHSYYGLSLLYREMDRYEIAEEMCQKAMNGRRSQISNEVNDSLLLDYIYFLGSIQMCAGKYDQAETTLRRVIAARIRIGDPSDINVLLCKHTLSMMLSVQGKLTEAEALCVEVLEARRKLLGSDHETTLRSSSLLGDILLNSKQYSAALAINTDTLERQEAQLGPLHPSTLRTRRCITVAYDAMGDSQNARKFGQETLLLHEQAGLDDRLEICSTLYVLGVCMKRKPSEEDAKFAQPFWERYFKIQSKHLGLESIKTLEGLYFLALCHLYQKKYHHAEELLSQCVELQEKVHGSTHIVIAATLQQLGRTYLKQERWKQAQGPCLRALKCFLDHSRSIADVVPLLWATCTAYYQDDKFSEAAKYYRQTLVVNLADQTTEFDPYVVKRANQSPEKVKRFLAEMGPRYCDGTCAETNPSLSRGPFMHCLQCEDVDICLSCFRDLPSKGDVSHLLKRGECSSDHDFIEVACDEEGQSGRPAWWENWRKEVLASIDDIRFLKWYEKIVEPPVN